MGVASPSTHERKLEQLSDIAEMLIGAGVNPNIVDDDPVAALRSLLDRQPLPSPEAAAEPAGRPPPYFGPGHQVDLRHLCAGATIRRYAEPVRGGRLDLPMPCCARSVRVTPDDEDLGIVACVSDSLIYDAVLVDEGDAFGDGEHSYAAVFTVRPESISVARLYPRR